MKYFIVVVQAGDLKDIQHVVHVEFGQAVRCDSTHQIRMAVKVEIDTHQQPVDIGITTRAQQVVTRPPTSSTP